MEILEFRVELNGNIGISELSLLYFRSLDKIRLIFESFVKIFKIGIFEIKLELNGNFGIFGIKLEMEGIFGIEWNF